MPTVTPKPAFSEITLQNGEKFEVVETFSTIMRHQKEALASESPLMDLMGPDGRRVAIDPIEIISVNELQRPTRSYGRSSNGKPGKPKKRQKTTPAKPATSRLSQRRTDKKKTGTARTRRRVAA